ncbi:GNAT family N-acetyltransferase [Paenibacillus silvisoli]|uniref:GNAT family N-acetyltransferase n=1 Tax=Paenibacillus silvisoli TaxID=3110539 RepID=UPI002803A8AB|nr:GNAT family N-acetyltransferase [Paenibacillus silvisoli]
MGKITLEEIEDGNIEPCRSLCNELMAFQKSKAVIAPEVFDSMNFDNRMKRSFEHAAESQVVVVKDDGVPVGYVFSTIDSTANRSTAIPDWAPVQDPATVKGLYPDWDELPAKVGCLNNLYLRDGYRDKGLGSRLFNLSMDWLESFPDVDLIFIYVSNGNEDALQFYLTRGFAFSHDVFGGFIKALYRYKSAATPASS